VTPPNASRSQGEPTLYEWAGGLPALHRMTRLFYEKYVPEDPLLSSVFANMKPDHPKRVATWFAEVFGGPMTYTERYGGYDWMVSQHMGRALTEEQRARWAQLISRCADEAGLPTDPEFKAAFVSYIEWGSRIAVENSSPGAKPPMHMPVPRWWWVCDATPGSRVSALAQQPEEEHALSTPQADEAPSFEEHVKPLFRERDRGSMKFAFDLWSYEDVSANADAILTRLREGSMPCDGAWPSEQVTTFERWIAADKPT
jgi:truncated hemoglobin YjbI